MKLDPTLADYFKVGIVLVFVPLLARRTYVELGRYKGWRSPWKRMLVVGPLLLVGVLAIAAFVVAVND